MNRPAFSLLAITPPTGAPDPDCVRAWLDAGAARVGIAVLLRTPGAGPRQTHEDERLLALRAACGRAEIPILLGVAPDRLLELGPRGLDASAVGLIGVQLRGDPSNDVLVRARARLSPDALLGRSVHTGPRVAPVDFTVFAPVFAPRTSQPGPSKHPVGLDALAAWTSVAREPVFALGGIDAENAHLCVRVGARGLAGISAFFGPLAHRGETVAAFVAAVSGSCLGCPLTRTRS